MELFYLIADFFNSMSPILRGITIVGIALVIVSIVVVCIVAGCRKKRRRARLEQQRDEWKKRALDEFISTRKEGEKELSERYNGERITDGVTAEPVLAEKTESENADVNAGRAVEEVKADANTEEHNIPSEPINIRETDYENVDEIGITKVDENAFVSESYDVSDEIDGEISFDTEAERDIFAFVKDKEKKQPTGFAIKLAESESEVKANYCDIVNYVLSYKKIKMKKSANSEKAYFGSNLLFTLKIHGKSLRVYYALRFADYEHTTMPVSYEGDKKSYEKTPVMLKITGPLSVKRAKMLVDDVAKRFGCEKGKEKTVISIEAV